MDVGLYHCGVDAKFLAILQSQIDRHPDHPLIDGAQGFRSEAVKGSIEGLVVGHRLTAEIGEEAQGVTVLNAFLQFAIVPALESHQNQGAQLKGDVKRNISPPTGCGLFCVDSQPPMSSWARPNAVLLACRRRRERAPPPSLWECGNRAPWFWARFPSAVETVEKSGNSEAP